MDNVVSDVIRDEKTFALINTDSARYNDFMSRYYQIKNQKDLEKQKLEERFNELETKVNNNSLLLKQIWDHLQSLKQS